MIFPHKIIFGKGAIDEFCYSETNFFAGKNIFVIISETIRKSGLGKKIIKVLREKANLSLEEFSKEPSTDDVDRLFKTYRIQGVDVIFGIGGGSVMDLAKILSICLSKNTHAASFLEGKITPLRTIGLCLIPTTAGSGSEVTTIAILTQNGTKKAIVDECLVPDIALLDPAFLINLPQNVRSFTMIDATSHAIESLWSKNSNIVTDFYSLGALNTILTNYKDYLAERKNSNHSLNTQFQVAAMHAGFAFNTAGVNLAHAFAYALTEQIPLPHGQSVAIALLPVLEYLDAGKINQIIAVKKYKEFIKQTIILVNNYAKIIYNVGSVNLDYYRMVTSVKNNKRLMSKLPIKISDDELLLITNKINEKITSFSVK